MAEHTLDLGAYWAALSEKERKKALDKALHARLVELARVADAPLRAAIVAACETVAVGEVREKLRASSDGWGVISRARRAAEDALEREIHRQVADVAKGITVRLDVAPTLTAGDPELDRR